MEIKNKNEHLYNTDFQVEFGDCDPAGIVFYANYFKWIDSTFNRWLRENGLGQDVIAELWNAVGTGVIEANASFLAPLRPGDNLLMSITQIDWLDKTLSINYHGSSNGELVMKGCEVRGLFKANSDGKLGLIPLTDVHKMLSQQNHHDR
jgi:YbgC/YbaW family acyl-CoA thioester hydrolase